MRTKVAAILFCVATATSYGQLYEASFTQLAQFNTHPTNGVGDTFTFEMPLDWNIQMNLEPFQSLTIEEFTITTDGQQVFPFPGFNNNVVLTIDELTIDFPSTSLDLNPATGGVFEASKWISNGTANLVGDWENFSFSSSLNGEAPAYFNQSSFSPFDPIVVDPNNLDQITVPWEYSHFSTHNAARNFDLDLEPNYELQTIYLATSEAHSSTIDIIFTPVITLTLPGDANGDGTVDGADFLIWNDNKFMNVTGGISQGDFDEDGTVDGHDFLIWNNNKFTSSAVPEPSAGIFVFGLLASFVSRHRAQNTLRG